MTHEQNPNEWDKTEYESTFYFYADEAGLELSDENKSQLKPLIEQARERGIPTLRLVEIVKEGVK
jgi:hypothetical protein